MPFEDLTASRGKHNLRRGYPLHVYGDVPPGIAVAHNEPLAVLSAAGATALGNAAWVGLLAPASAHRTTAPNEWGAALTDFATNFVGVAAAAKAADDPNRKINAVFNVSLEVPTLATGKLHAGKFMKIDVASETKLHSGEWVAATDQDDAQGYVVEQAPLHLPTYDTTLNTLGAPVKVEVFLTPHFSRGHAAPDWNFASA